MPRKPISFELDFMVKDIFSRFTVKQFDDVSFNIKPLNQGLDYDTTGMIGKIFVGVNNDMFMQTTNISVSSNNINVLLDKNMLQKSGRAYAEIELTDKAGTITSSSFIFDIDPKIGEGGMIPGEYEGFVEKYERLIAEFKSQVNSSVNSANSLVNDVIKKCNTNVDNKLNTVDGLINAKISDIEKRFNALTTSKQQDAEVVAARDGEISLNARLERDLEKGKTHFVGVEGSSISIESQEGYLENVEIYGNTCQDSENLSDIRSVGTKVEGQELYEIPVLSTGKNIWKPNAHNDLNKWKSGTYSNKWIKLKPNTTYSVLSILKKAPTVQCVLNIAKGEYAGSNNSNSILSVVFNHMRSSRLGDSFKSTFTTPSDGMVCLQYYENGHTIAKGDIDLTEWFDEICDIHLEEANIDINKFEPYQEHKLTILSPTPLEKVGDVADRIVCKDGVWGVEKNIQTKIIDGSDSTMLVDTGGNTENALFLKGHSNDAKLKQLCIANYPAFSNMWNFYKKDVEGVTIGEVDVGYGENCYCITISKNKASNLSEAINYLKNNPVLVKYQLAQSQFIPLPHDQQIKLRTFVNKTNISFLTEIEPTIKAQVPKSLGATVNTHTTQIDNLNKELDRVKKLEESTVSTVITDKVFTTVAETTQGYFEDVKIEGKTLVNLKTDGNYRIAKAVSDTNLVITNSDHYLKATTNGEYYNNNQWVFADLGKLNLSILKSNTKYTVIGDIIKGVDRIGIIKSNLQSPLTEMVPVVNNRAVLTTNDLSSLNGLQMLYGEVNGNANESKVLDIEVKNLLILEGDHTDKDISYFEGLKSAGQDSDEISISSVNENLLSEKMISINKTIRNSDGVLIDDIGSTIIENFKVNSNITYYFTGENVNRRTLYKYDYNNKYIGFEDLTNNSFSVDNNVRFVTIKVGYYSNNSSIVSDLMVSTKETLRNTPHKQDTKQILYYNPNTQTWEKPILREWDSIEKHSNGKYYYHKRSEEVLYVGSDEIKADCITDMTTTVKKLSTEEVYECTNLDLITYQNETNLIVNSGAIQPKITLKVLSNVSNVVKLLQEKVSVLENKFIEGLKQVLAGDMMSLAHLLYPEDFNNDNEVKTLEEL